MVNVVAMKNFSWHLMCWNCLVWLSVPLACWGANSALERGAEAFRQGNLLAAESALREAVALEPGSAFAHKLLGLTYSAQEKYAQAEPHLRQACEINPHEENACYYLGRAYYSLNRYPDSEGAFTKALSQPNANRGRVFAGRALTMDAMGQTAKAEQAYRSAIDAGESAALVDYGMFLFRQGRMNEAIVQLTKANATTELEQVRRAMLASPASARAVAATNIRFTVQPLPMIVRNGATGSKHQIETMPAGVAAFDYNNDGWPDIYVANGAPIPSLVKSNETYSNRLFRNNRDGTFTDVTAQAGVSGKGFSMGVAAADYDNDGWTDLFITGVRGQTLYRNQGDGTFKDVTQQAGLVSDGKWSVAAGWFDYDNDGHLDLLVVRYVEWDPASEPYCGLQKPGYRTYCHPEHYKGLTNLLYHNEGNGAFRDVSATSKIGLHTGKGMGVVFGDMDGDGLLDAFVANDTTPNFLFHNKGDGTFDEIAMTAGVALNGDGAAKSAMGADFRDYDNDGREDLLVTDLTNERFLLFRNLGKGAFGDVSAPSGVAAASLPWTGWSTGVFDLNNDGRKDIFVAAGNVTDNAELTSSRHSRQPNLVFVNQGGGKFLMQELPGVAFHRGAAFADFNHDGRVDVVVTRLNEAPLVLTNVTPGGHWLELRLQGTKSNRDGIGAQVHLVSPSGEQWNRVATSVGYGGSSDRTVHFGLGNDSIVQSLTVTWPSGIVQILKSVAVDGLLTITEASN